MTLSAKRIAILFHKGDRHRDLACYIVHHLADFWRADGHEVLYLFGTSRFVPADLILVHVNLSVVPDAYIDFASRYPIALNGRVRDIRKTTISPNLLGRGDPWRGPVIVKSDLNYAGLPERALTRSWLERHWRPARRFRRGYERLRGTLSPFGESSDYTVYDRIDQVPSHLFVNRYAVVEKFLPEIENGLYHNRIYQFLGDRWSCTRLGSTNPIVKSEASAEVEDVEPHEEVVAWRERLGLDYGKLDYMIHDGEVVLLDANKTTGASLGQGKGKLIALRAERAKGLYSYFR